MAPEGSCVPQVMNLAARLSFPVGGGEPIEVLSTVIEAAAAHGEAAGAVRIDWRG